MKCPTCVVASREKWISCGIPQDLVPWLSGMALVDATIASSLQPVFPYLKREYTSDHIR